MLIHEALLPARQMLLSRGVYYEGARDVSRRRNQAGDEHDGAGCIFLCLQSVLFFALGFLSLLTCSSLFTQSKSQTLAVKRKAESEEEKEESPSVTALLPARSSPVTDSPKNMEEKSALGGEVQRRTLLVCANDLISYSI